MHGLDFLHQLILRIQSINQSTKEGARRVHAAWPVVGQRKIRTHLDLLSIPQSGGKMSKRLGGIMGCKYKTFLLCFSHSASWLPTRKNYFTRWPVLPGGLMNIHGKWKRDFRSWFRITGAGVILRGCSTITPINISLLGTP